MGTLLPGIATTLVHVVVALGMLMIGLLIIIRLTN